MQDEAQVGDIAMNLGNGARQKMMRDRVAWPAWRAQLVVMQPRIDRLETPELLVEEY